MPLERRASEASVPKPKLYHRRIDVLTTREQWAAIERYAKAHKLRWGEAIRQLVAKALEHDSACLDVRMKPGDLVHVMGEENPRAVVASGG